MSDGLGPSASKLQAQPKGMPNAACSDDLDKTACLRQQSKAHEYSSPVVVEYRATVLRVPVSMGKLIEWDMLV